MEGIRLLTPELTQLGVISSIVCLDPPDSPWLAEFPCKAIGLGPGLGKYSYRRGIISKLRELITGSDIVVVHGLWQYHSLAALRALSGSTTPYLVQTHGMLDPWFKRTFPLKHVKKWLYWPWSDYLLLRNASYVVFTCEREMQLARESFWLYKAREVVIGYGTSDPPGNLTEQRKSFLCKWPGLRNKRIILYLSRIHPKKGLDDLIRAFSVVCDADPSLHLVIAGPDQIGWQSELQQIAIELGIDDKITWCGMLSGDLKWGAFHCAEIFCLPSHQENFGIAVSESLACGVPVSIAEPVNISGEVSAYKAGLVHVDTTEGCTWALRQWLLMSVEERRLMGENARSLYDSHFNMHEVALRFSVLLRSIVVETVKR